jgi:hypothetical protein
MKIINFDLIKHPMNWIIVILMVFIAGVAFHLVLNWAGISSSGNSSLKTTS